MSKAPPHAAVLRRPWIDDWVKFTHELFDSHPAKRKSSVLVALKLSLRTASPDHGVDVLRQQVASLLPHLP